MFYDKKLVYKVLLFLTLLFFPVIVQGAPVIGVAKNAGNGPTRA